MKFTYELSSKDPGREIRLYWRRPSDEALEFLALVPVRCTNDISDLANAIDEALRELPQVPKGIEYSVWGPVRISEHFISSGTKE